MHPYDGMDDGGHPVLLLGRKAGTERAGFTLLAVPKP
jgi:hypothetical protein